MSTYNQAIEDAAAIAAAEASHIDGEIWIAQQIAKKIRSLRKPEAAPDPIPARHGFICPANSGGRWIPFAEAIPPSDRPIELAKFPIEADTYGPWIGIGRFEMPEAREDATHWRFLPTLPEAPDPRDALIRELTEGLTRILDAVAVTETMGEICQCDDFSFARDLVAKVETGPTHRHLKTGGLYRVLYRGKIEADLSDVVIYRAEKDGTVWVRPAAEFDDGRFALVAQVEGK